MDYVIIGIIMGIGFTAMGFAFGFTSGCVFTLEKIQKKIKDNTNEKSNK